MDPELTKIVGIAIAGAVGVIVGLAAFLVFTRKRVEGGWQATQNQRNLLYDRLKTHGLLVREFIETAEHRLAGEVESLEVLGRRQTKVGAGRTPAEKAAALIELNSHLEQLISVADKDPGLSGLSEYEVLRDKMEQALDDIGRAAANYNETVDAYNRQASGPAGRMFGAMQAEPFDASMRKRSGPL